MMDSAVRSLVAHISYCTYKSTQNFFSLAQRSLVSTTSIVRAIENLSDINYLITSGLTSGGQADGSKAKV
jgi:hypothetical protein